MLNYRGKIPVPGKDSIIFEGYWQVGQKRQVRDAWESQRIELVEADDYELAWIKENFVNLPYRRGSVSVRWTGDMARFIMENLPR